MVTNANRCLNWCSLKEALAIAYKKSESWPTYSLEYACVTWAPYLAVNSDLGWNNSHTRQKVEMVHFWNCIIAMDNERLSKMYFYEMKNCRQLNWSSEILLSENRQQHAFRLSTHVNKEAARNNLHNAYKQE